MSNFWTKIKKLTCFQDVIFLGIINTTPDSFSDGGKFLDPNVALTQAVYLLNHGINILDIGAESTRPGAIPITAEEEWLRLKPVLTLIRKELPNVIISLDTRNALTASRGLDLGVSIINDVTGFSNTQLMKVITNSSCGLIAMRSTLVSDSILMPDYYQKSNKNIYNTFICELKAVKKRLLDHNIDKDRILLDPGFGFGTTFIDDFNLWNILKYLPNMLEWPIERFCIGISRKRFLAFRDNQYLLPASQRDQLTRRAHNEAIDLGYRIFRTHAETK